MNIFALLALGVALLMMALAGPLVRITFGGFDQQKQMLTAQLTQIMLPSLSFVVVSIVLSSVLNANERYLSAQLTGFPLTVAVIIATVGFSRQYGMGGGPGACSPQGCCKCYPAALRQPDHGLFLPPAV